MILSHWRLPHNRVDVAGRKSYLPFRIPSFVPSLISAHHSLYFPISIYTLALQSYHLNPHL